MYRLFFNMNYGRRTTSCHSLLVIAGLMLTCCGVVAEPIKNDVEAAYLAGDQSSIEVIQVTAQKRQQAIQNVPISIQAYNAAKISRLNARTPHDLAAVTPGLESNALKATQTSFNIRGIHSDDFGVGTDSAVAVYKDGVYVGRLGSANFNFNNIKQVEVLKGPQGTLFGRNAAAGAIIIDSQKPTFDNNYQVKTQLGDYDLRNMNAKANIAINSTLALTLSGQANRRDGFVDVKDQDRDLGNEKDWNLDAQLLWQPNTNFDAILRLDRASIKQDARPAISLNPAYALGDPFGVIETDYEEQIEKRKLSGAAIELNYHHALFSVKSLSAYREFERYNAMEDDGSAFAQAYFGSVLAEKQQQTSQELIFTGHTDNWQWTLGGLYFEEDIKQMTQANFLFSSLDAFSFINAGVDPLQIPNMPKGLGTTGYLQQKIPPAILQSISESSLFTPEQVLETITAANYQRPINEMVFNTNKVTSYAVYADATYRVNKALNISLGLRFSEDQKDFTLANRYQNVINIPFAGVPPAIPFGVAFPYPMYAEQSDTWQNVSPRAVVDYQVNDHAMSYLSYSQGYKSGGFNTLGQAAAVDEEQVTNWEWGVKSQWLNDTLLFNLALFDYRYQDLQQHELVTPPQGIPSYQLRNVDAKGKGLELESQWLTQWQQHRLTLAASYAYLDTAYTQWSPFAWEQARDINHNLGQPISGTPENSLYLSGLYNYDLGQHSLNLFINWHYQTERQNSLNNTSASTLPYDAKTIKGLTANNHIAGYGVANLKLSFLDNQQQYQVSIFVDNLLDEEYLIAADGKASALGSPKAIRGLPRMWGLEVQYNW